jgi:UDP-N-acetylmuramate dehydrogenase
MLGPLTTLGIGGPADVIELSALEEMPTVAEQCYARAVWPVSLGHGSNVLVADAGVDVPVLRMATRGVRVRADRKSNIVFVTADAGEPLAKLIEFVITERLTGIETLSGIPGTVGAMPVQNVGAYGQDTAGTLVSVAAWDWRRRRRVLLSASACHLGHRRSIFKRSRQWTILRVTFRLARSRLSQPVNYLELAEALQVRRGTCVAVADLVEAVNAIRRRKGMILDPTDPDTRSAGTVFVSPTLSSRQAADLRRVGASVFRHPDGLTRVGPNWLMRAAGFRLGQVMDQGVRLSTKHYTLVTSDTATSASFARAIWRLRERVRTTMGINMVAEPDLLGCEPLYAELCRRG